MLFLRMEHLKDFFKMFEGKEADHTVFVSQLNEASETHFNISVIVTMRFIGYDDATIMGVIENIGTCRRPYNEEDERNKRELGLLEDKAVMRIKDIMKDMKEKGFTVYEGVWSAEGL